MCNGTNLFKFLDLGFSPPSDNFLTEGQLHEKEIHYPLDVYSCKDCGLCQLGYVVPPELMFNENYPYESSITKKGREHFISMAQSICSKFEFEKNSLVIDVGSNVGVLLSEFQNQGMQVLGIEPSSNVADKAKKNGIDSISEFFSSKLALKISENYGKASIITGTNVFAHVDDLDDFVNAAQILLTDIGILVIEAPHLGILLNNLEYDTIYHEHLSYLSLKPMITFFKKYNMDIFDVQMQSIHGGSYRYFIAKSGKHQISENIHKFLEMEEKQGIYSEEYLKNFSKSVCNHRLKLIRLLDNLKKQNKKIVGISSPAKGNTLLNFCRIGPETIDYITERIENKIGKFTPGTHIPIFTDDMLITDKPDYALILAWNFADEIIHNNKKYLEIGGKFIIPIPEPIVLGR